MRRLAIIAALLLAACGPAEPEPRAVQAIPTPAAVAAAPTPDDAVAIEPGRWTTRFQLTPLDASGRVERPAEDGSGTTYEQRVTHCVTATDARKRPAMFAGQDGRSCRTARLIVQNGRLSGALACDQPRGRRMAVTLAGPFAPRAYDLKADASVTGGGLPTKRVAMRASGYRLGPCRRKG